MLALRALLALCGCMISAKKKKKTKKEEQEEEEEQEEKRRKQRSWRRRIILFFFLHLGWGRVGGDHTIPHAHMSLKLMTQ